MDPLEKLAEKNRRHEEIRKKERLEVLGHLPFSLISLVVYIAIFVFLGTNSYDPNDLNLQEMSKQVWFFAMVLSAGVGAICFIGSLSFLLWIHLIARHLKSKVSMIKLFFLSFFSLSISLFLLLLGSYFDVLIHNNAHSIAKFMRFGFEVTPFPIEMAINFVIVFFAMLLLQVSMYVAALPFKAKRHATEIKAKTNRP